MINLQLTLFLRFLPKGNLQLLNVYTVFSLVSHKHDGQYCSSMLSSYQIVKPAAL